MIVLMGCDGGRVIEGPFDQGLWKGVYHFDENEWGFDEYGSWPSVGNIKVRFYIDDLSSKVIYDNYIKLKLKWEEIWPRIIERILNLRGEYGCEDELLDITSDYIYIRIPVVSYENGGEWSVMLQSESGWLIDFKGWDDAGGQGVF